MEIKRFAHKGLRKLYEKDDVKGVPPQLVDKLKKQLAFLQDMADVERLKELKMWKAHQLTGNRKGTWSLHVTANDRLTFRVSDNAIVELDLEDYH